MGKEVLSSGKFNSIYYEKFTHRFSLTPPHFAPSKKDPFTLKIAHASTLLIFTYLEIFNIIYIKCD